MADIVDYDSLVSAIQAVAEDDGAEFLAYIPTAIGLAEERLIRENDFPERQATSVGTLPVGITDIARPADFVTPVYLLLKINNERFFLRRRTEQYLIDYWPNATVLDTPKYYSSEDIANILVVPTPSVTSEFTLKYIPEIDGLTASNTTNYYVDNCPDLLFNAAMVEIARFMKAWTQVEQWQGGYRQASESWNWEQGRKMRDDGSNPQNPAGGTNSLKNNIESGSST